MTDLEIIGAPQSTYVRTVRIACEEKGVAYRLTPAMPHSPEVNAIHPLGKIPVMRHGAFQLFESRAIAAYVDRAFPGPQLFPEDARECAAIEQWVSVANTTLIPRLTSYLQSYFFPRTDDGRPNRVAIDAHWPETRAYLRLIEDAVSGTGHLVGDRFTYADMNLLPSLVYLHECRESGAVMNESASLRGYLERHNERASLQATVPPTFPR